MRANVSPVGAFKKEPPCGSHGYWIGSGGNSVSITLECGRWDCPECGVKRTNQWFALIDEYLPGSVLYVAEKQREKQRDKNKESNWIRRIVNGSIYYCIHTSDEAIVFSNKRLQSAEPRNRSKFIAEIRKMMETGKVKNVSRSRNHIDESKKSEKSLRSSSTKTPRFYAWITEDLYPQYKGCESEYEIGLFLKDHSRTPGVKITERGKELIRKIETGEVTENNSIRFPTRGAPPPRPPVGKPDYAM